MTELKKVFVHVPAEEAIDVPSSPRVLSKRAWAVVIGKYGMAALGLLFAATASAAAVHYRDTLSRAIPAALFAALGLFLALHSLREALWVPRVLRDGQLFPADLVLQGAGDAFRLRLGSDHPRADESLVELDNSLLAVGLSVAATIEVNGKSFESMQTVSGGDAVRMVRCGDYIGAAVLADAQNPERAVLITRYILPRP